MFRAVIESPIGFLEIQCDEESLLSLTFYDSKPEQAEAANAITREVISQLKAYFNKEIQSFDLPLNPSGTDFQKAVWKEVARIPFGKTRSYQEIANQLDNPGAVRAVGLANGKNPIPIIIPCHRVIGANGKLTGYSGGLSRKSCLLEHEGALNPLFQ